jgi:hypothetical protein
VQTVIIDFGYLGNFKGLIMQRCRHFCPLSQLTSTVYFGRTVQVRKHKLTVCYRLSSFFLFVRSGRQLRSESSIEMLADISIEDHDDLWWCVLYEIEVG